jgi:hypothetical protein
MRTAKLAISATVQVRFHTSPGPPKVYVITGFVDVDNAGSPTVVATFR